MTAKAQSAWRTVGMSSRRIASFPVLHAVAAGSLLYVLGMSWGANSFRTYSVLIGLIYLIAAFGLNVIFGFAGIISIGHAASFGLGAYTTAILTVDHHWGLLPASVVAIAVGAASGAVMGLPAGRVGSLGLGIITLGYLLVFGDLVNVLPGLTGGGAGKIGVIGPLVSGSSAMTPRDIFLATVVVAACAYVCHWYLRGSHFGRTAIAVKENPIAAAGLGANAWLVQISAFAIGGALAAVAGSLFSYAQAVVDANSFGLNLSIQFLLIVIIGGAASRIGPVVGAVLLGLLPYYLSGHPDIRQYIYGGGLIAVVLLLPRGIIRRTGVRTKRKPPRTARSSEGATRLLELDSVHRHFAGVVALDDVSLSLNRGDVLAVIGPNGSGKTTLLNIICGIYWPQRGTVRILEHDARTLRPRTVANLGVARTFQVPRVFPSLTVQEHLVLADSFAGKRSLEPGIRDAVDELLGSVGIEERLNDETRDLGHGQLRFLEIAMGLLRAPDLLLLDEPTSGLSAREMEILADVLARARACGLAVIAVEHHLDWVRRVATRVIVLHNGHVLWDGAPDGFAESDLVRSAYLGDSVARVDRSIASR